MKTTAKRKQNKLTVVSKIRSVPEGQEVVEYESEFDSEVENDGKFSCLYIGIPCITYYLVCIISTKYIIYYSLLIYTNLLGCITLVPYVLFTVN